MQGEVSAGPAAGDERAHAPGHGQWWGESWYFDFATPDGALGGYVRIGLYPNRKECWYWACLVGEGRRLVTVVDHEVPMPRLPSLEVRHHGLWADHTIEVPFDHATLGCEAFALALDDPADACGEPWGDRVPFGLDLEWHTDGPVVADPAPAEPHPTVGGYEVPCCVEGEVLVGDERIEVEAIGRRSHHWGPEAWVVGPAWFAGRLDDGTRFGGRADSDPGAGRRAGSSAGPGRPPGAAPARAEQVAIATREEPGRFPAAATLTVAGLVLDLEPVAFAPVPVTTEDGQPVRLVRALSRVRDRATGRRGSGWAEWAR